MRRNEPCRIGLFASRSCVIYCVKIHTWLRHGSHMATNLSIDPDLIERALEVSGERTKKAAVTKALQEFIARRRQKRLLELMGKLEWDTAYDYQAERARD
jgi:Arc/MetJ family transcription regulator